MKKILKIISLVLLIGIVGVSILTLVGCEDFKKKVDETVDEVKDAVNDLEFNVVEERGINLAIAPMNASTSDDGTYQYHEVVATITNSGQAPLQYNYQWSLEWLVAPSQDAVVDDYVNIDVDDQDPSICLVKCYEGFSGGKILLTCEIVPYGVSATCLITYGGAPEFIVIDCDSCFSTYSPSVDRGEIRVEGQDWQCWQNGNYVGVNWNLRLDNTIHNVGSDYLNNEKYDVEVVAGYGGIVTKEYTIVNGEVTGERTKEYSIFDIYNEIFDISDDDDTLDIGFMCLPSNYTKGDVNTQNGTYEVFYEFLLDEEYNHQYGFTIDIKISHPDYGISNVYHVGFDFEDFITSVSLNESEITFTK